MNVVLLGGSHFESGDHSEDEMPLYSFEEEMRKMPRSQIIVWDESHISINNRRKFPNIKTIGLRSTPEEMLKYILHLKKMQKKK